MLAINQKQNRDPFYLLAYRVYLDIPSYIADTICCWRDIHCVACDDRRYQRAATSKHYAFRADSLTPPSCATRKVTDHDTTNDADMVYKTVGWFSGKHWRFDGNVKVLSNR